MRAVLLSGILAALVLSVFGVVRYPGLRAGNVALGAAGGVLVVMLGAYALCALTLLRGTTLQVASARRRGLLAGVGVGAAWIVLLAPTHLQTWVVIPLGITPICPWSVAASTARVSPDARTAPAAALWSGLVGGLLVFVIWVTATYLNDGRPYDPQLIRDFHHSGAHDLGGFKRSSQRLLEEGCDGQAEGVGVGDDGSAGDAVAGQAAGGPAGGSCDVLAGGRGWGGDGRRCPAGGGVGGGWCPVVSGGWRDAYRHSGPVVGALPVVR